MTQTAIPLHFGIEMPEEWKEGFEKRSIDYTFKRYDLHSSFIVNFWKQYISIGFLLAIGLFFLIVEKASQALKFRDFSYFMQRLRLIVLWNLTFLVLLSTLPAIVVFATILFKEVDIENELDKPDVAMCVLTIAAAILIIARAVQLIS